MSTIFLFLPLFISILVGGVYVNKGKLIKGVSIVLMVATINLIGFVGYSIVADCMNTLNGI